MSGILPLRRGRVEMLGGDDRERGYTRRAKKVLALAQEEARRFDHPAVGAEHLLLGLLREGSGVGPKVLAGAGLELPRLREALLTVVGRGDRPPDRSVPASPSATRALEYAAEEARALNDNHVGTEHILLGITRLTGDDLEATAVHEILAAVGFRLETLRQETLSAVRQSAAGGGPAPRDNVVASRVDDRTLGVLDALVEAGVYSTRSEAAARLIVAGIEANQELLERVYAAVAQVRRVRAEAQELARPWKEQGEQGPRLPKAAEAR